MTKVLIVGHVSMDKRFNHIYPGGPPMYQLPYLLAKDFDIHLVTSTHKSYPFIKANYKLHNKISTHPTTFRFDYDPTISGENRILYIDKKAHNIEIEYLENVIDPYYDIIVLSPIANELDKNTMEYIVSKGRTSYFDIQGIVRQIQADGKIYNKLNKLDLDWALKTFDIIKASYSEIGEYMINPYPSSLIITNAGNNIYFTSNSESRIIKTLPCDNVVDDTGSGDIFLVGLAISMQSKNIISSLELADKLARKHLINIGLPDINIASKQIEEVGL